LDGQDGIEKAKELTPDLIMMDLSMPQLKRGIATI
jgi:YesN/AraC family two-component response regulator